ncbi:MAG: tyrosine-type recombinase/integrase [Candidatus Omnitrophota bacterium]
MGIYPSTCRYTQQFKILGKGDKERYVPINPHTLRAINDYLASLPDAKDQKMPLFRSISNNGKNIKKSLSPISVYRILNAYAEKVGIDVNNFSPHSLRATAATNALEHGEDLRKVQDWLGHASIQTTAMYDKRNKRPEDSPSFRVRY